MTPVSRAAATIAAYFTAINADRFADLAQVFATDVVIEMGASGTRRGCDDAIAYYPRALAPFARHHDDPVQVLVSADDRHASVEIAFTGATAGGHPVEFTAVDLFDFDDSGRVVRLRSLYDTATVTATMREALAAERAER